MDGNLDQFMEGFLKKEANLTVRSSYEKVFTIPTSADYCLGSSNTIFITFLY